MPWSNEIANPLTLGGDGQIGKLIILDAANNQIGYIDETGIWIVGSSGESIRMYTEPPPGVYTALEFNPETIPGITWYPGAIGSFVGPGPDFQPYVIISSPSDDVINDYASITLIGSGAAGLGEILIDAENVNNLASGSFYVSTIDLTFDMLNLSFFGSFPEPQQDVAGAKGGNVALGELITALANYGLITDSTTP